MSITTVRLSERRALWARSASLVVLVLTLLVSLYSLYRGAVFREALDASVRSFVETSEKKAKKARQRLIAIENGSEDAKKYPWAGLAMDFSPIATARPGVLADLAVGVSDIQPTATVVSQWRTVDRLFANYEFESPVAMAAGPFDFSFVVIFILPLVLIVLCYDVLSEERESGRLGLLLSYPISVRDLVVTKLRVRAGAVVGLFAVVSILGLVLGATDADFGHRLERFAVWMMVAILYLGCWASVIAWIVSLNRRSETTVLMMVACWALNSLVGPAVLSATAESLYPAPSRLEYLSEVRRASSEAYETRGALTKGLALEHPELAVDQYALPEYIRTAFVVSRTVDRKVQPVIDAFDRTHTDRVRFLRSVQYASPAIVALRAFNDAAGTSLDRQRRFERQARAYKHQLADRVGSKVLSGQRLSVAELDGMPVFTFEEPPVAAVLWRVALPSGFLLVLAALFGGLARRNLDRLQTRVGER